MDKIPISCIIVGMEYKVKPLCLSNIIDAKLHKKFAGGYYV